MQSLALANRCPAFGEYSDTAAERPALDLIEKGCAGLLMTIMSNASPSLPGRKEEYLP